MEKILRSTLRSGAFLNVNASRSRTMSKIRGKHNRTTEAALRMALVRAGVRGWEMHPTLVELNRFAVVVQFHRSVSESAK